MPEQILISFQRTKYSIVACDYLCSKLDSEDVDVIKHIQMLTHNKLKKLKADDANYLVRKLLQAIIINDDLEETIVPDTDAESETGVESDTETETGKDHDSGDEADSENDQNNTIKITPNNIIASTSGEIPVLKEKVEFIAPKKKKSKPADLKTKDICKFFKNGRCNKEEGKCGFLHPKICRKFNQFGGSSDHVKGCKDKCGFFHPNACRNSLKSKTCS